MELLQFILFGVAYNYLNINYFINFIIFILFLKVVYNSNIKLINNIDPLIIFCNMINIMLHLIVYQTQKINKNLTNYTIIKYVSDSYSYLNNKFMFIKNRVFNYIFLRTTKIVLNKPNNNLQIKPIIKKTNIDTIKLNTNKDISDFLDKLLE